MKKRSKRITYEQLADLAVFYTRHKPAAHYLPPVARHFCAHSDLRIDRSDYYSVLSFCSQSEIDLEQLKDLVKANKKRAILDFFKIVLLHNAQEMIWALREAADEIEARIKVGGKGAL